ncbi:MAG: EAL domain-containing protein [Chromatiales bacterium]|nr:EAL domain-containing protein [Chromatiales bacterium]
MTDTVPPGQDRAGISREETELLADLSRKMAAASGPGFFEHLVTTLARALKLDMCFIGALQAGTPRRIRTLAVAQHGKSGGELVYELPNLPCDVTLQESTLIIPHGVRERFPQADLLKQLEVEGYVGIALRDSRDQAAGILVGITHQPIENPERVVRILHVFAAWSGLELERRHIDNELHENLSRYSALFNLAGDTIFIMKGDRIIDCNQRALSMFGLRREEIIGLHPDRLSPPLQPDGKPSTLRAREHIQAADKGEPQFFEWQHQRGDGSTFDAEVSLSVIDYEGERLLQGIVRDITRRKRSEQTLRESEQALKQKNQQLELINRLAMRLHRIRDTGRIAEEAVDVLTGLSQAPHVALYLMSEDRKSLRLVHERGFNAVERGIGVTLPLHGSLSGLAIRERRLLVSLDIQADSRIEPQIKQHLVADGYRSAALLPLAAHGDMLGLVALVFRGPMPLQETDLDTLGTLGTTLSLAIANVQHIDGLRYQALHDPLTGLLNRTALHNDCRDAIERQHDERRQLALLLLDLDRFKEVNDTLGHKIGDDLLRHIGPRVSQALNRQSASCYRLGGDEFAVLLPRVDDAVEATRMAEAVVDALRQPFQAGGMNLEIGGSIGVAVYPEHGTDSHALLRCADVAMYAAKRTSVAVTLYRPELDANTPERLTLMSELGMAIREGQLVLHYQPKIDIAHQRIIGCEALVRWHHPSLGIIPPDRFIPLAEMSDLIQPLTEQVVTQALIQLRAWHEAGLDLSVSVNLSVRNLLDHNCGTRLEELFERYPADPSRLELEITETALMSDPDRALEQIQRIGAFGVRLSIDDFGTGYSSLAYLKRLPLHALKIDRSFVSSMLEDEQDLIIVRSTINLAHSLGLDVVAEGVEDRGTAQALRAMDCDYAQGFYFNRPLAPDDFIDWCRDNAFGLSVDPYP